MNLGDMLSEVRLNVVDDSVVAPRLDNQKMTRFVNSAIRSISINTRAHTENVDVPMANNSSVAVLPVGIRDRFVGLRFAVDTEFSREIHIRKIDEINDYRAAFIPPKTVPDICTVLNQDFIVAPSIFGARTFRMTVYSIPTDLVFTDLASSSTLPAQLHTAVVYYTSSLVWRSFEDNAKANDFMEQAAQILSGFIPDNLKRRT